MEVDLNSDLIETEAIPDAFLCCICLDLLYKPVVLVCGHISCFWCVHHSMNNFHESHCPTCRHPYYHFPSICQMFHLLLLKMYPHAYERRKKQILEQEMEIGNFSPELDTNAYGSHTNEDTQHLLNQPNSYKDRGRNWPSGSCLTRSKKPVENMEPSEFISLVQENTISLQMSTEKSLAPETTLKQNLNQNYLNETCECVSISDVMCTTCKQIMFRPAVLNCGHVFCETCIILSEDEMIRCSICQTPDPRGIPKVCLILDQFFEEQFPKEYASRRDVQTKHQNQGLMNGHQSVPNLSSKTGNHIPWCIEHGTTIHSVAGCDSCGMYPIIGERYRCMDCMEQIGFDLCGYCYSTPSKLPGRFNQQHRPEHRLEKVTPTIARDLVSRLVLGQLRNTVNSPISSDGGQFSVPSISRLLLRYMEDEDDNFDMSSFASEYQQSNSPTLENRSDNNVGGHDENQSAM